MPTPDDITALAHDVRIACLRVARRNRYDVDTSLSPHLFTVLAWLEGRPMTAAELAKGEKVSAPSMSRTVKELEERGLVQRHADPDDGRRQILTLTDQGLATLNAARSKRDEWMTHRLASRTREERELLAQAAAILNEVANQ